MPIHPMKLLGAENRYKILDFLRTHPGATYQEIARGCGITAGCVRDHMKQIKAEWRERNAALLARRNGKDALQPGVSGVGGHAPTVRESEQLELF